VANLTPPRLSHPGPSATTRSGATRRRSSPATTSSGRSPSRRPSRGSSSTGSSPSTRYRFPFPSRAQVPPEIDQDLQLIFGATSMLLKQFRFRWFPTCSLCACHAEYNTACLLVLTSARILRLQLSYCF
jgi:hypothetical protein